MLDLKCVILVSIGLADEESFLYFVADELVSFEEVGIKIIYFFEFGFLLVVLRFGSVIFRRVLIKVKIEHMFVGCQVESNFHFG